MRRVPLSLAAGFVALALAAGGCAYESSGTTTTTAVDPAAVPPATGPAALTFADQMVEGSVVVVASVTTPAAGFVVLQSDAAGTPGEVLGVSELIGRGTYVPTGHIPFTPRAKKVLELSLREALQLGHNYIGT